MANDENILVAGGAGFLGSHLCERLLKEGNHVICIDNFYTGARQNIEHLTLNPNFELICHDISIPFSIKANVIYNLASPASPVHYQRDPLQTVKTNVYGAINLLELARKENIRILQASTSEVYGNPSAHPQNESYWGNVNCTGVRACYDEGKRCAETIFFDHYRSHKVPVKVIRIFNTYGPRMQVDDGRVVSSFIVQALSGQPITIFGDGKQTRSFCYVDDLIEAMTGMMQTRADFVGPINLGNPNEISILELAETIIDMTSSKSRLEFRPLPQDDPVRRCPDIALAKKFLDWQPRTDLKTGLLKTVEYFKSQLVV